MADANFGSRIAPGETDSSGNYRVTAGKVDKSFLSVCLLVVLSLGLNLYGIHWGLPNGDQDWANDSLAPLGPLVYAKRLVFHEPWSSKYPPFHYMVLTLFYAPYALYLFLTGDLTSPADVYPYGLKDPAFSLMVFTLIARVVSAMMGTGTVLVNYYTVKILYGRRAGLFSALLVASSYVVIFYSHNANVEVPQLFWTSLALYSFVMLVQTYATKYYVLLGLFTAFAVGTKDSVYALFLGLALPLLWFHIRHVQKTGQGGLLSALYHGKLLYGFFVFAIAMILVLNLPFNWQGFANHVELHLGTKSSVKGNEIIHVSGDFALIAKYLIYLVHVNGLPAFLVFAGGFVYCLVRFPQKSWPFLLPLVTYYLFFLRVFPVAMVRYLLPVYLILTWQAGKLAADFLECKKIPRLVSITVLFLMFAHSLVYGFSLDLLLIRDSRYSAEQWMREHVSSGAIVLAYGPSYSLPNFPQGLQLRRIELGRKIGTDIETVNADYLVLNMSVPTRVGQEPEIYQVFAEKGYRPVALFKSALPPFGAEVFHTVNPRIVIFQRIS